jgi:hypothetical protein
VLSPTEKENAIMSNLSRRTLVTGAAALPALAVPAIASEPIGDHPDAELLRLGAQLERVEAEWLARCAVDRKRRAAHEAACIAAGLPKIPFDGEHVDEYTAYEKKRARVPYEGKQAEAAETDEHGSNVVWVDIHDRMFDLIDKIMEQRSQTVAGLAVQARAIVMDNAEWWDAGAEGTAPEQDRARLFLESLCSFLRICPAPISNKPA